MSIEVGGKVSGKVSGITNFGAFIDLGEGKTGLVHISEVSNNYVKDINEVLTVGDAVDVKVMSVGTDGKIGLSIRRLLEGAEGSNNETASRPPRKPREERAPRKEYRKPAVQTVAKKQNFDDLMSDFMKDSEDRLLSLKRNTEGKRGGRGGRRS
ncbi:S1 domain-containing RNA-binding protein [Vagococcus xieshaowenii]|uniref:RNA-binding protein S1 n=1 Tax=Vagococcus xieshaowenii TaxID=2562451 RepID=A0A4Z0D611_9ENTE|nr:S1 domain-containing RNA-binding protein [Vagococcus xieshaowenii]QCA28027.1 RNA-binding protein S1 [Vagococcus xieshaowenii]TFZ40305.1 RNA-binding protein S1 [Vagococcus xieshaowenii]